MPIGASKLNTISKILDSAPPPTGKTITLNGGGVIADFVKKDFGRSYSNPTANAYAEVSYHPDFAFGTSTDFTVEAWCWFGATVSNKYVFDGRPDAASLAILFDGNSLKVYIDGAYRIAASAGLVPRNAWVHIAYTRQGTTGTLWYNGSSQGTWTDTTNYTHSNSLKLMSRYIAGQGSADSFCAEFRISNTARYTTTFTPSSTPFNGDANTLLLLHFDETAGSTTATDSSSSSYTPVNWNYWAITPGIAAIDEQVSTNTTQYYCVVAPTANTNYYLNYSVAGVDQGTSFPTADIDATPFSTTDTDKANVFTVVAIGDSTTEGPQSLVATVYSDSGRTNLVATSAATTINDTSLSPPSFTYVGQGNSLATTVTIPSIAAAGDIAVLFDTSLTTTLTVPSGWTTINSATTTGIRTTYSYKTLVAGEPGSSITGMAGTTRKIVLVFRPDRTPTTITATSNGTQATTAAPTNQNIPLLSALEPNLAFAVFGYTTSTPSRTWTQTGDTSVQSANNSTSGITVRYEINNAGSNPQNATISMTDGGTNTLQTGYIVFT